MTNSQKEVKVKIATDVEQSEVEALEKKINQLRRQKIRETIEVNTSQLDKVNAKIHALQNEIAIKAAFGVDDSQIKKAEKELQSLKEQRIDLEIAINDSKLDEAKAKVDELDDKSVEIDVEANMSMQNISQGIEQAKQALGELKQNIDEVSQAGMQSEQNKAFLEMNLGAEKAKQTYQDISNIVASMPGDDNTMRSVLSTAQALGNNLNPDEMKAATATMADYMAGSATMGKMATESQQDIMKYLLDGNTAELERGSIVSSQVDKLKEANTFMERQAAMQEVLNQLGYGGIANQDTMLNKQAEWEGMMYNSQDALSSMWLGAQKGAMDYILKLNDASNGLVGMGIVAGQMVGGPLVSLVSGLGQIATGINSIKALGFLEFLKNLEIMTKLSAAADWLLSGAQTVLNAVMAMNPIVLVVLALIALAAALIWAYQNVDWFREAVNNAFAKVREFGQVLVSTIQGAIQQFASAVEGIPKALERCLQWAYDLVMGHPLVQALIWLGNKAAEAFSILGLGQGSPGKIYAAMQNELDWTEEAVKKSTLPGASAGLGEGISDNFNTNFTTGNRSITAGTGGNNITINIDNVDSEDRIQQIVDAVEEALRFDNLTAGRSV